MIKNLGDYKKKSFFLAFILAFFSTIFASEFNDLSSCGKINDCSYVHIKTLSPSCKKDFELKGTFLLMQANMDNLEFALISDSNDGSFLPLENAHILRFSSKDGDTNWNFGSKLALGFSYENVQWEFDGIWTYFKINNDFGKILDSHKIASSYWISPTYAQYIKDPSFRWEAFLNAFDLLLKRPYYVSNKFVLNPTFGVKFASILQNLKNRNRGVNPRDFLIEIPAKNNFFGFGPLVKMQSKWLFNAGFYLQNDIGASVLFSHFDVSQYDYLLQEITYQNDLEDSFYTMTPYIELSLSLGVQKSIFDARYLFDFKAGYEIQMWLDQNRTSRNTINNSFINFIPRMGSLYLSGFYFQMGLNF